MRLLALLFLASCGGALTDECVPPDNCQASQSCVQDDGTVWDVSESAVLHRTVRNGGNWETICYRLIDGKH